jgi:hypothetical protein
MGPRTLVIKRGEYGAILFHGDATFMAPGYLLESVFDPTGAGDSFAGGFIGYLAGAASRPRTLDFAELRRAVIYGSVMGSFCCEKFGVDRFRTLTREEIDARYPGVPSLHRVLNRERGKASCWRPSLLVLERGRHRILLLPRLAALLRRCRMPPRTSPAASWIRKRPATTNWARGCRCRIGPCCRSCAAMTLWHNGLAGAIPSAFFFTIGGCFPVRRRAPHLPIPPAAVCRRRGIAR